MASRDREEVILYYKLLYFIVLHLHCRCIGMQHYQSSITSRVNETEVIDAFRPGRLTVTLLQDQGQLCSLRVDLPRIPMLVLSESMGYCPNVIYYIDLYSLLISCDFLVGKIA